VAQHFLLSPATKTLTLASVARMSDEEAERVFMPLRWQNGEPHCPRCGCYGLYQQRRATELLRWRCKACNYNFSITSGTIFASRKLPLRLFDGRCHFHERGQGQELLALSRDLGLRYKAAFCMAHKLRECMGAEVRQTAIGGEGKKAEIDGAYFGGYVKPANRKVDPQRPPQGHQPNGQAQSGGHHP
jgi:transposase-like protein